MRQVQIVKNFNLHIVLLHTLYNTAELLFIEDHIKPLIQKTMDFFNLLDFLKSAREFLRYVCLAAQINTLMSLFESQLDDGKIGLRIAIGEA